MRSKRLFIAIFIALALGVGIGAGSAVLKFRQHPWKGGGGTADSSTGGRAAVDQDEFNFGKMDFREDGKHEFTITNRGDQVLTVDLGSTSCKCTVGEIEHSRLDPGQSTKVLITWHGARTTSALSGKRQHSSPMTRSTRNSRLPSKANIPGRCMPTPMK